ncbi:hypothetical protein EI71_01598 [Anaeroplasma bactoclasticum]|jgi:hypothetical protein|uniref:Uncharacterized protein n=1 Tax=Anaeroplasma bactoclasticum TaxID=2088 RepID=A0A397R569_9MOLU|nr:hypothetical protein [Anaeroplasma bactoclasticum]RIA66487.1 hypothetical protein EI71_01598 [Anaeroplasma bactoclasticum]
MPNDEHEDRRLNSTGALFKTQLSEMLKNGISVANGKDIEVDYHEGKGSKKDYSNYPKEFFTESLDFKGKIDLILKKKEITLKDLEIIIEDKELKKFYKDNTLPKEEVLIKLSNYSGYPISFFKEKPMMETTKNNHKRNVIIAVVLLTILIFVIVFSALYITKYIK